LNDILKNDEDVKEIIPINPESDDLFHSLEDGIILSKLINASAESTIDFRAVNMKKNMNIYQVKENLNLALNACKGIGLKIPGINPQAFIEKKPHLILAVVWQVMRLYLTKSIDLKNCPEIMRLAEEGEELHDLMKLPAETILLRWINYHLKKQGQDRRVNNLGGDLKDSIALTYVLNRLDPANCSLDALKEEENLKRAETVIRNAESIGVPPLVRPSDITTGNVKINTIFVAELFNTRHGLEELNAEEKEAYEAAGILNDDIEGSRDERAFRFWINSLNIEDLYVNNLYEEVRDGLVLLKVVNKLDDKVVDWKKVEKNPNNKFKQGINCGQVIESCKKLGLKIPGIGGSDFVDGNTKNIIAVVWQLVRLHYLKIIGSQSEEDLVKWSNNLVDEPKIKNFKDPALADGQFLLKLCGAIEPRVINWEIVMKGETDEEKENNAKYICSVARKLGAVIFCVWEDIAKVNYKMILVLVCSLFEIFEEMKNKKE
jgi:plastin-1